MKLPLQGGRLYGWNWRQRTPAGLHLSSPTRLSNPFLVVTVAVCSATKQLTRAVPEHDHVSKQRVGSDYNFLPQISTGASGWSRFARAPPSAVPGGGASCHLTRLFNPVGGHHHLISTHVEEIGETLHPCLLQHYQVLPLPAFLPSSLDTIFHAVQICKTFR